MAKETNIDRALAPTLFTNCCHPIVKILQIMSNTSVDSFGVATISRLLKMIEVSFAKEPYRRDDILQKRPIILRSLLIVATPFQNKSAAYEVSGFRLRIQTDSDGFSLRSGFRRI